MSSSRAYHRPTTFLVPAGRVANGWNKILLTTAIILMLIGGPALAQDSESATERNRLFIAEAFQKWAPGGGTFFQDVLAPDVVWIIKGTGPAAGIYRSRQDFLARAVEPFATRLPAPVRPTVRHIWADGDHVIVQWDGEGTAADGKPYRNSYVWIFEMAGLSAIAVTAFLDLEPYDAIIRRVPLDSKTHARD